MVVTAGQRDSKIIKEIDKKYTKILEGKHIFTRCEEKKISHISHSKNCKQNYKSLYDPNFFKWTELNW